ncbi:MAG: NUDIX hydrolase [Acidobacteria bacterium]|nr:MAG: NUDIX hydrolase [Acidobacteriota bacterium]
MTCGDRSGAQHAAPLQKSEDSGFHDMMSCEPSRGKMKKYSGSVRRKKNKRDALKPAPTEEPPKAKVLSSRVIYEGAVFGIRRDEVIEPSGVRATREMITHPGSVVVLPVLPDGRILLIQQYRYAARQYLWELVAGRVDPGENPRQAAARELIEETGYRAKRFRIFLEFFPTPGFLEEKMFLLLAEELTPGKAQPEEDEKIIPRAYNHRQLEEMIRKGKLRDAKTIAGILYYLRFLAR